MVVAHELSHQWFGDLVTPAWWDDIWLNESFANWMGYRIGNEWRPELNIGVGALDEGFGAMNTDALVVGRPIHQPIADQRRDRFRLRQHHLRQGRPGRGDDRRLPRRREVQAGRPPAPAAPRLRQCDVGAILPGDRRRGARTRKVLAAFKSFVDQQGVPVVDIRRDGSKLVATQSRYAFLGSNPQPRDAGRFRSASAARRAKSCTLLDQKTTTIDAPRAGPDHAQRRRHRLLSLRPRPRGLAGADRDLGAAAAGRSAGDDRQPVGVVPGRQGAGLAG